MAIQIKKGDQKAFESVFNAYYRKLLFYAKEYVCDLEIAREFVQEAFLKLWEIRKNLNDHTNLEALLFTILRNDCLNYLKRIAAQKRYTEFAQKVVYELQLNYLALKDSTSEVLQLEELQKVIDDAIAELPPKCREIFIMSRYNGMKYKEIADKLGISYKTVENQISEALKRIRQRIDDCIW
ncbi:MAG: RNA polymerase sigma-70 factor [Bacteroidales bacterium]|nr:RNA polymerase sigma-70 factor [Bacteroidales bacterium]